MATNFPGALDTLTNPTATDTLDSGTVPHADQHANANDAIEALEAKVGINSSGVTSSHDYKIAAVEALVVQATMTARGTVELATDAEAQAGADTTRAITAANLAAVTATETRAGVVELATTAEAQAGADTARAITAAGLASVTATETRAGVVELATTAEVQTGTDTARAITAAGLTAAGIKQGTHTLYLDSDGLRPPTTNGAAEHTLAETTSNKNIITGYDFDAATIEYLIGKIRMPKSWDEGTITAEFAWRHGSTTTNFGVSWGLQAVAISNDDTLDAAWGTAQYANDTGGTTDDLYISPATSAITIAGTPQAEDMVYIRVLRKADDGANDTLAVDATLLGVTIKYGVNSADDS